MTLKKLFFLLFIAVVPMISWSQRSDSSKIKHHEIGIDVYPIAYNLLKPDPQNWVGGGLSEKLDYNFTYRFYFKSFAARARLSVNYSKAGESVTVTSSGNYTYRNIVDANYDRNYRGSVGIQYNFRSRSKVMGFVGLDYTRALASAFQGNAYEVYDTSTSSVTITKNHGTYATQKKSNGVSLVFGLSFRLKQGLFFTLESAFAYSNTNNKFETSSFSSQYYEFNSQVISYQENKSNSVNKYPSSINRFLPTNNFTLSYRF